MRSAGPRPLSASIDSTTSTALPTARPSGWSIEVSSARVGLPMARPMATMAAASSRARALSFMNAPRPNFTSSTSASMPSASFFDMMLAQISGIDSTVAVTSRERVELAVGGHEFGGLADHGHADAAELRGVAGEREVDAEPRDGFELVERAAGVAEAAAAHHRHRHAAGGDERGEDQRDLVPHPAGGMLVDLDAGNAGEVGDHARVHHRLGEAGGLFRRHAAQEDGHEQRGRLVIGPFAPHDPVHEGGDLVGREGMTVAFAGDDGLGKIRAGHGGRIAKGAAAQRRKKPGRLRGPPAPDTGSWGARPRRD